MKVPKHSQNPALNVPTYLILLVLAQRPRILWGRRQKPSPSAITLTRLPERGLLPDLFCNANTSSTWADPSLAFPIHLYSVSLPLGTCTHAAPLLPLPSTGMGKGGGGVGAETNHFGWLKLWWRAATGCFCPHLLSVTLLSLPSGHSLCISLVLIFADKCWLSCCAAPSYPLCGRYTKARPDLLYKWALRASTTRAFAVKQSSTDAWHVLCAHMKYPWAHTCKGNIL